MSQKEMILEILALDGCITTYDAIIEIGCTRLSARINELRESGFSISSIMATKKNRFGVTVSFKIFYLSNHFIRGSNCKSIDMALKKKKTLELGRER